MESPIQKKQMFDVLFRVPPLLSGDLPSFLSLQEELPQNPNAQRNLLCRRVRSVD